MSAVPKKRRPTRARVGADEPERTGKARGGVRKVTVSLPPEVLEWAKRRAEDEGSSVSAVVTAAVRERQRLEAMREVDEWLGEGRLPLTDQDLEDVRREWRG
jgi:hypothetical protein